MRERTLSRRHSTPVFTARDATLVRYIYTCCRRVSGWSKVLRTGVNASGTLRGVAGRAPKTRESKRRRRRGGWCDIVHSGCVEGKQIKHLSTNWGEGVVNTGRPLQVKYWGS